MAFIKGHIIKVSTQRVRLKTVLTLTTYLEIITCNLLIRWYKFYLFLFAIHVTIYGHINITIYGHINITIYGHINITIYGHINITMSGHINITMSGHIIIFVMCMSCCNEPFSWRKK